ncbi:hypothetical protein [Streptomyces sp900116325]|uniref:Uncharacterized protein n=1 Tax=Streptomyces sp. 900116325 TaxID=3154295 RepID=A0ABV2UGY9_9ACTN
MSRPTPTASPRNEPGPGFAPLLRQGLIDPVDLLGLRSGEPNHVDDTHDALVRAVVSGDAESAARIEPETTLTRLRTA